MVNLALIIKYKNKSLYKDLPKMLEDAKMMKAMLSSHNYEIELPSGKCLNRQTVGSKIDFKKTTLYMGVFSNINFKATTLTL